MSYRDELEAARARAAALEEELADKERALAERERALAEKAEALAEKDRALADAKEDLEEAAAEKRKRERERARADEAPGRARGALDALADKGRKPPRAKPPKKEKPPPSENALARRRLLRSVTWFGDMIYDSDSLILVPASTAVLGGAFFTLLLRLPWFVGVPLGASVPVLLAYVIMPLHAHTKLAFARRWPGTLPYRLEGYPELLERKPRKRGVSDDFFPHPIPGHTFDPEGHTRLLVKLTFRDAEDPPGLASMLKGFDPKLLPDDGGGFSRESPVSENFSKSGSRRDNSDHNLEVHRWVRRLHRKVLRHLAAAHELQAVSLTLR